MYRLVTSTFDLAASLVRARVLEHVDDKVQLPLLLCKFHLGPCCRSSEMILLLTNSSASTTQASICQLLLNRFQLRQDVIDPVNNKHSSNNQVVLCLLRNIKNLHFFTHLDFTRVSPLRCRRNLRVKLEVLLTFFFAHEVLHTGAFKSCQSLIFLLRQNKIQRSVGYTCLILPHNLNKYYKEVTLIIAILQKFHKKNIEKGVKSNRKRTKIVTLSLLMSTSLVEVARAIATCD
jgi:hypothetical protein